MYKKTILNSFHLERKRNDLTTGAQAALPADCRRQSKKDSINFNVECNQTFYSRFASLHFVSLRYALMHAGCVRSSRKLVCFLSTWKPLKLLVMLIIYMLSVCLISLQAQQKEIAVTIDDLPLNGQQFEAKRLKVMTDKTLEGINKYQIPVVGFVNESLLYAVPNETDARIAILKSWSDAGVELGNHTFSHLGFQNASLADFEDDFVRGDAVTKMLMKQKGQKPRYFRHPFLQMGATQELEKSFDDFIAQRGYKIVPVTIGTMDWMFLAAYAKAKTQGNAEMLKRVSYEYLKFVAANIDYCEKVSNELFGRPIKHILLLHANELNADNFDALIKVFKDKGYQFISVEQALKDSVYQFPDKYAATSDWLSHWTFSKGKSFTSPTVPDFIQKIFAGN